MDIVWVWAAMIAVSRWLTGVRSSCTNSACRRRWKNVRSLSAQSLPIYYTHCTYSHVYLCSKDCKTHWMHAHSIPNLKTCPAQNMLRNPQLVSRSGQMAWDGDMLTWIRNMQACTVAGRMVRRVGGMILITFFCHACRLPGGPRGWESCRVGGKTAGVDIPQPPPRPVGNEGGGRTRAGVHCNLIQIRFSYQECILWPLWLRKLCSHFLLRGQL